MAKYRKKPVVIEAEQFLPDNIPAGVLSEECPETGFTLYYVVTIHCQKVYLKYRDWIILEPDEEHHYPCKPDIFEATYEKV